MAIPTIIGTSSGGRSGIGGFTVTPPAGAVNYIALVCAVCDGAAVITPPTGFYELHDGNNTNDPNWNQWHVYYSDDTAGASWNLAGGSTQQTVSVVVVGFADVLRESLFTTADFAANTNPWSGDSPSVTLTEPALVMRAVTAQPYGNVTQGTTAHPTSALLGRADKWQYTSTDNTWTVAAVAFESRSSTGSTGTAAWQVSGMNIYNPVTFTLALTAVDPIVAYNFDEGSGVTTMDQTGNGRDATVGSTAWSASGHTQAALAPTGSNYASRTGLGAGSTGGFTWMAWVNRIGTFSGATRSLFRVTSGTTLEVGISGGDNYCGYINQGSEWQGPWGTENFPIDTWVHVAGVIGTSGQDHIAIYINGVRAAYQNTGESAVDLTLTYQMGYDGTNVFPGLLDDVRIFDKTLVPEEIAYWMTVPVGSGGGSETSPVYLGTTPINKLYYGDTQVNRVYHGADLVMGEEPE